MLKRLLNELLRMLDERRAYRELQRLDDRMLRDIGFSRDQLLD